MEVGDSTLKTIGGNVPAEIKTRDTDVHIPFCGCQVPIVLTEESEGDKSGTDDGLIR